ncbi:MAG TPA: hypothetical protein DCZ91_00530 [Lachnospiraceae bacterium]|nr:hypothetical protein [Lachnospiraceae bacterium]
MSRNRKNTENRIERYAAAAQVIGYFIQKNRAAFWIVTFTAIVEGMYPYIVLILMGMLLDGIREGLGFERLAFYILAAFGIQFISGSISCACRQYYNRKFEYIHEIEGEWLNRKGFTMDYEYLEDVKVQELRTRGETAWAGVAGWAMYQYESCLSSVIAVLAAVVLLIPLLSGGMEGGVSLQSVLATLLLGAVIGALMILNYRKSRQCSQKMQEIYNGTADIGNRTGYYHDILANAEGQKDLRCYGQQEAILEDVHRVWIRYLKECKRLVRISARKIAADQTTSELSALLVYVFTSVQAILGTITVGQVVTCSSSMIRLSASLAKLAENMGSMEQIIMLSQDQKKYMELEKRKQVGTIPLEKRRDNRFRVQFEHVSFRYPGSDRDVIKDLNLEFIIGERMALVGRNGSGKSTFIKLLCRLYDVTEGCIKVNGIDIRKYDYREYCNLFSVVFQDFVIFAIPVGENIAASVQVDEDKALDALDRAGVGERVRQLPEGLAVCVGKDFDEAGVVFSGGEKQKMAIARAIYKDAPFVIMDEPTAALDPQAECEVFAGFDKMVGSKTALYISHRLASCRFCQDILVFDEGKVIQRGSHEELERQEGLYKELWEAQAQYYA